MKHIYQILILCLIMSKPCFSFSQTNTDTELLGLWIWQFEVHKNDSIQPNYIFFDSNVVRMINPQNLFNGEYNWEQKGKDSIYIHFDSQLYKAKYKLSGNNLEMNGSIDHDIYSINAQKSNDSLRINLYKEMTPLDNSLPERLKGNWIFPLADDFYPYEADLSFNGKELLFVNEGYENIALIMPYYLKGDSIFCSPDPQLSSQKKNHGFKGKIIFRADTLIISGKYTGRKSDAVLYECLSGPYIRTKDYQKRIRQKYKTYTNYKQQLLEFEQAKELTKDLIQP